MAGRPFRERDASCVTGPREKQTEARAAEWTGPGTDGTRRVVEKRVKAASRAPGLGLAVLKPGKQGGPLGRDDGGLS